MKGEIRKLEVRYLANPEANLFYALFSDFTDAPEVSAPGDAALLKTARDGIASLNAHYPGDRFLLFHRPRIWSETQQSWIGRERKRGKIEDLNDFLAGNQTPEILQLGRLPGRSATSSRWMPIRNCRPEPRGGWSRRLLIRSTKSRSTRIHARGAAGIRSSSRASACRCRARRPRDSRKSCRTPPAPIRIAARYRTSSKTCSAKASFTAKPSTMCARSGPCLRIAFRAETLLSHDLIEGAYAGVAMATDIELLENVPLDYSSFVRRQHRWIRGDWQIAPWIFPQGARSRAGAERNPLTAHPPLADSR